ncbi:MAG TPA: TIGR02530 family flagellar biosynthesis protein [Bacteroidota bacterium]|nr:TIGR02530 family flagellar biosynthesis protein [Bacteroidota bacterium]
MADTFVNGVRIPFVPAGGIDGLKERPGIPVPPERSFEKVLQQEMDGLKFSKHAQERLNARQIQLNESDLASIQSAVEKAGEKGSQDSLVLLRDLAFIVSVKNKTVVTAVDAEHLKNNVFTNIDSAVIAG